MAFQFNQGDRPLPGYTILRGVGRGGFGEVYYATSDGGKEVALKFLRENPAIELRGVQHCLNLKSPYLVALHDIKQNAGGDFFVIMEFVNGSSLRELMNDAPQGLGPQKAAYLIREIGKGLAYLHDRGIVHRDLKPGNIFYEDGYVKIGDYGLAKLMAASQHSGQTVSVGTVHYMAPEVGSGNYDRTIDIYAMGVILYEMLLGRVPFAGATMGEVLMKHLTAQPAVDELPAPFPDVIRKALAKDPKERYQNVNEMMADLFAVEAIDQSVATFEPASLSVAANRVARDLNVTMSASPRPPAAVIGMGSSNVGAPPIMHPTPPPIPKGHAGRFGRLHDRIQEGAGRIAKKIDQSQLAPQFSQSSQSTGGAIEKILIALLISAGLSVGVSIWQERSYPIFLSVIVFMNVVSIVQAVNLGCWLSYERNKIEGVFIPRLIMATFAFIAMAGVAAIGHRFDGIEHLMKGAILVMFCCDWGKRYYDGRRGIVSTGSAFGAGISGLIFGSIFGGVGWTLGTIAAAASLAVQAIAGLRPLKPGEQIPRTGGDEQEPATPNIDAVTDFSRHAPAVAVELADSADNRGQYQGVRGGRGTAPAQVASAAKSMRASLQIPRSRAIRTLWLMASGVILCAGILFFAAPELSKHANDGYQVMPRDDRYGFIIAGIAAMHLFLFSFSRAFRSYRIGMWRGVLRPFIFFAGLGTAACSGAAWGLFNLHNDEAVGALAAILGGALTSLFVWLVPIGAYAPSGGIGAASETSEKKPLPGSKLKLFGVCGLILMGCVLAILGANLDGNEMEEVAPAVAIPMSLLSGSCIALGFARSRRLRKELESKAMLTLPLRRCFEIDRGNPVGEPDHEFLSHLFSLMDTHLMLLGYRPVQKSDMIRTYMRGTRLSNIWQKDVRRWATQLNIALYNHGDRYGVNCYLDLESDFREPSQKNLHALCAELADLQQVMSGREIPANTPLPMRVRA